MELKQYQKNMANFLAMNPKAILSVDMGLGKTLATLAFLDWIERKNIYSLTTIIVAPKRVALNNWKQEMEKFGYTELASRTVVIYGLPQSRQRDLNDATKPIKVISRDFLKDLNTSRTYDILIIDELTSFKNITSQRTKAICNIKATRKIGLTGTFLANGAIDMYAQCLACDIYFPEQNFYAWRAVHFRDILAHSGLQFSKWQLNQPLDELIKPIKKHIYTLTADDWLEIPEVTEHVHEVVLHNYTYKQIAELDAFLSTKIGDQVVTIKDKAKFAKLQTMCNGFVYNNRSIVMSEYTTKLDAVLKCISYYTTAGESVLVFYAYVGERKYLESKLDELKIKHTNVDDAKFVAKWNDKEIQVLLAHPASAGHGLNLQYGGRVIVWSTLTYNYEFFAQGNARLARQGQRNNVQIHYFIAKKTCEERVIKALMDKDKQQKEFLSLTNNGKKGV